MKRYLVSILFVPILVTPVHAINDLEKRATASRATIKVMVPKMKQSLMGTMKAEGPVKAISVCRIKAPKMQAKMSKKKGWQISRTSLKYRNEKNKPDRWERKILKQFEERKANGENIAKMEHYEVKRNWRKGGKKEFRYMKAIPMAGPCMTCHAGKISPKIEQAIAKHYPNDKARGFKPGDIRGAFTIRQPI